MQQLTPVQAVARRAYGRLGALEGVLPPIIAVQGRIGHSQVWKYVGKLKHTTKEINVIRFSRFPQQGAVGTR